MLELNPKENIKSNCVISDNCNFELDPFIVFEYSIRSRQTRDSYFRRLQTFFGFSNIPGPEFKDKCNYFAKNGRQNPNWSFKLIFEFLQYQKQRVEQKEITSGTLKNYQKTIKSFCETTDILIPWKKITKGLPRGKRYADDRSPTLDEIRKIIEYPDRRIKAIISVMVSSGIRVGAWDYLKWGHIIPIEKDIEGSDKTIVAAKMRVYAEEDDEYFTFISPEAYRFLKDWMDFRQSSGELVTKESWIMRNLWNTEKLERITKKRSDINTAKKLSSVGIKRLVERALWSQNLRTKNKPESKRYEFQTDHGFRKFFKTRCELGGMKPINIEKLMGHSTGISDSYYRATENELLEDYVKILGHITISRESVLSNEISILKSCGRENEEIRREISSKVVEINDLKNKNLDQEDAISALSDRLYSLIEEVQNLKKMSDGQMGIEKTI
jgi:integrase